MCVGGGEAILKVCVRGGSHFESVCAGGEAILKVCVWGEAILKVCVGGEKPF